ncbi:hypothetical protein B0H66DRAFT_616815 [Apodospora peruviana]|uniref:NmrA-like domain-containing protein n=1 Tax=Apodospora peruviana TaxID=516989 RepID=A0AAE0IJB9_9PEZI|nr:hypothetical protein B0H66DRAFT_616815 [Apodospora peruviana]
METIKVAIVGATGATGTSIVNGLLASDSARYEITALIRPPSMQKPAVAELEKKGVRVVSADLTAPQEELVKLLTGIDVVISAIYIAELKSEMLLADAAKAAGVKRFIPCFFATVIPPKGVTALRDMKPADRLEQQKEDVLNHIKKIHLGYTVIDVGWWYQISVPRLPSGRIDYALTTTNSPIAGEGKVPSGLTDLRDVGKFVAKIIADPRTLNRMVFAYTKLWTQTEVRDLMDRLSGEKCTREYMSPKEIEDSIAECLSDPSKSILIHTLQYLNSWGVRGDNTPETAKYLGYLIANELYPELVSQLCPLEEYFEEVLDGKGVQPYGKLLG